MHLLTIPPGGRAKAHLHESHETAIYVISGEADIWYGDRLEDHVVVNAGEFFYIPAGVPHLPANLSDRPTTAVIARTDPNEQESVVLRPDLDALVAEPRRRGALRTGGLIRLVVPGAAVALDERDRGRRAPGAGGVGLRRLARALPGFARSGRSTPTPPRPRRGA